MDGLVVTSKLQALKHCAGAAKIAGSEDGWLRLASKELRRRGCILIWSNDRGGAPALKHCAGAHKMDGLVVTCKLKALKHCAGAAKIARSEDGRLRLASKELRRRGCILIWSNDRGGAPALKHCAGAHKMDG